MDPILDQGTDFDAFTLSQQARSDLYEAARWGKFLAIVGFVFIGLMVLIGLGSLFFVSGAMSGLGISGGMFVFLYLFLAAIYFFPTLYLYRFSTRAMEGLNQDNTLAIEDSLANLRSLFKFMGIITIIMLSLYGLLILFWMVVGVSASL